MDESKLEDAKDVENVTTGEEETKDANVEINAEEPPALSEEEAKREWKKVKYFLEVWSNPNSTIRDRLNAVPKEHREELWHSKYKKQPLIKRKRFRKWFF